MTILLVAAGGLVGLFLVLTMIGLFLPRRWRVTRSTQVLAKPDAIYPLVANFREGWRHWSPFGPKKDPSLEMSFSGPVEGPGASQSWKGKKTPAGQMTILEANPATGVRYVMQAAGFELTGTLAFLSEGAHTTVTWADEGEVANPLFRYFGLFAERAVGKPFEEGLAALKQLAEAAQLRGEC